MPQAPWDGLCGASLRSGVPGQRTGGPGYGQIRGNPVAVRREEIICQELTPDSFKGIDLALFSAGGGTSLKFAPFARDAGCVVVDNSSAWRMDPEVPLVVPGSQSSRSRMAQKAS